MNDLVVRMLERAQALFEDESSGTHGDAWASLEQAANEIREPIDAAEKFAEDALDLPSWTGTTPNWKDAIGIASRIKPFSPTTPDE